MVSEEYMPSSVVNKLLCSGCGKYLSYFPIYTSKGNINVCGRCSTIPPDFESFVRNEIYEISVQFQKFPCINESKGCLEKNTPSKVPQHEKYCQFNICKCPMKNSTTTPCCTWQGKVSELLEHFEKSHVTFILKNTRFEIDIVDKYDENYLLPNFEELFIVNKISTVDKFRCMVSYIGSNPQCENYCCNLIIENPDQSISKIFEIKLSETFEITRNELNESFQNPVAIVMRIELFPKQLKTDDTDEDNNETNREMLDEIECPVCLEYMVPPIMQCETGHSMCKSCVDKLPECPSCKKGFNSSQNFSLEKIIRMLDYPCKHDKCKFTGKSTVIKQHEKYCIFGPYHCPLTEYEHCAWAGPISDVFEHVNTNHYENILEIEKVVMPFDDEDFIEECFILKSADKLFRLHFKYENEAFYWSMQLIGTAEESTNHKFEVDILHSTGGKLRLYFVGSCAPLSSKKDAFNEGMKHYKIELSKISELIVENVFCFRVRILPN